MEARNAVQGIKPFSDGAWVIILKVDTVAANPAPRKTRK